MSRHLHFWGAVLLIVTGAMLLTVLSAYAQPRRSAPIAYEWRFRADDPEHVYLYRGGVQVGGWSYEGSYFRQFDAATRNWGVKTDCPVAIPARLEQPIAAQAEQVARPHCDCQGNCPCRCGPACHCGEAPGAQGFANHGIDLPKMAELAAGRHYHLNGREVNRAEAFDAVAGEGLPDDADALRVTWIGPAEIGQRIRGDVDSAAALGPWKGKVCVQAYGGVDEPILEGLGYAPGLAVQAPAGKPLWYAAQYQGPEDLAGGLVLADARRKDPNWDPAKWSALNVPPKPPVPAPAPAINSTWLIVAAAVVALVLFLRPKVQS